MTAPLLLSVCAVCSAREGVDVFVMPTHAHREQTVATVTINGVSFAVESITWTGGAWTAECVREDGKVTL